MRRLIASLLIAACATPALAQSQTPTEMTVSTKAGGVVHVTDTSCEEKGREKWRIAYLVHSTGRVEFGCYFLLGNNVMVHWREGGVWAYDAKTFSFTK